MIFGFTTFLPDDAGCVRSLAARFSLFCHLIPGDRPEMGKGSEGFQCMQDAMHDPAEMSHPDEGSSGGHPPHASPLGSCKLDGSQR